MGNDKRQKGGEMMLGKRLQAIVFCIIAVLICVANLVGGTGGLIMSGSAAVLALSLLISIIVGWFKNEEDDE